MRAFSSLVDGAMARPLAVEGADLNQAFIGMLGRNSLRSKGEQAALAGSQETKRKEATGRFHP
jgi:hypothetical protein